jgi:endonuclease/exonuclease/phosphatase family metal-dependent hydrolase
MSLITEQLTPLDCDILCLQEVYGAEQGTPSTFERISASTGLQGFHSPARFKHRQGRWSSSGLSVLSRWPIQAAVSITLPSDLLDGERIAQRVDIDTPHGPLRIINLHLTHLAGPEAARLRQAQLEEIHHQALILWTGPIVFAGDFNASPGERALEVLLGRPDYQSSADRLSDTSTLMEGTAKVIDLIVLRGIGHWDLTAAETVLAAYDRDGVYPSDHKGVMATIASR